MSVVENDLNTSDLVQVDSFRAKGIRLIGDSIASQNSQTGTKATTASTSTTLAHTNYPKFWNQFLWQIGNPCGFESYNNITDGKRYGSNSGIGGDDWLEVFARLPALLAVMPEKYLFIHCGTNDINAGVSVETMKTRITNVVEMILQAGVIPILSTILPRNNVDGSSDWNNSTGGTTTAQKRLIMCSTNNWMKAYAREKNLICVDFNKVFSDASGNAITGYTTDSVHPSGRGSCALRKCLYNTIGHLFPRSTRGMCNAYNLYDATYNPNGNIITNAIFAGTSGTHAVSGGVDTTTGDIPTNWYIYRSNSTTSTACVSAITTRTDGLPGNVWELEFETFGTGSTSEDWRLIWYPGGSATISGAVQDGLYRMSAEIEYKAGTAACIQSAQLYLSQPASISLLSKTTISFDAATKQIRDSANGFGSFIGNRTLYVSGATNAANNSANATNKNFKIVSATAGVLQLSSDANIVDEAAGASISLCIPLIRVTTSASVETTLNEDSPVLYMETPIMQMSHGTTWGAVRIHIYVDGTTTGKQKVRIALPFLNKVTTLPSVLNILAHDE